MFIAADMRPGFSRRSEGRNSGWHVLIQHSFRPSERRGNFTVSWSINIQLLGSKRSSEPLGQTTVNANGSVS
jgi:hypothetical protein